MVASKLEPAPLLFASSESKTDGESQFTSDSGSGSNWEQSSIEIEDEKEAMAIHNIASRYCCQNTFQLCINPRRLLLCSGELVVHQVRL